MSNTQAVFQIPVYSRKVLSCFTTDHQVISKFALRGGNKTAKQKANYFYQNTVVSKSREEQRKIMLSFISTLQKPSENVSDFCIRLFNNFPNGFQRFNVHSPDDLVLVLKGLYSSNTNQQLNSVIRFIATHAITNTFEEIIELNRGMAFDRETVCLSSASLTDTVYSYAAPTLNRFIATLSILMFVGILTFIVSGMQGVFSPFNATLASQIVLSGMEGYLFHTIAGFTALIGIFMVPIGLGFYLTDKLHPLKRIQHIEMSYRKTLGCCLLFFGSLGLSYFSFQAYEERNPLVQMVQAKDQAAAFEYIDQNYKTPSDVGFMKSQVLLAINDNGALLPEDLSLLRYFASDFVPVDDISNIKQWDEVEIKYPNLAVNQVKIALFGQVDQGFYMNKSFYQFMVSLLGLLMIITSFMALKTMQKFHPKSA
jgi:hypothetical protein